MPAAEPQSGSGAARFGRPVSRTNTGWEYLKIKPPPIVSNIRIAYCTPTQDYVNMLIQAPTFYILPHCELSNLEAGHASVPAA